MSEWLQETPDNETVVISPASSDSSAYAWWDKHRRILDEWSLVREPSSHWKVKRLEIRPAGKDSLDVTLKFSLESRGRYNSKFSSPDDILLEEWKKNGRSTLQAWEPFLTKLYSSRINLSLQIQYKHKNYMRPNEKLQTSQVDLWVFDRELRETRGHPDSLYTLVEQRMGDEPQRAEK